MNQYQARKAIAQRWITLWPAASGNVPFVIDNDSKTPDASFARLFVDFDDTEQRTMGTPGNRRFTCPGVITIELYAPPDSGSKRIDELVGIVTTMFDSLRFPDDGGIQTWSRQLGELESTVEHHALEVSFEFEFYETR